MRALLVVNPAATRASARLRTKVAQALGHGVAVQVEETQRRGHATELAGDAARAGVEAVIAVGGDGTVNEVVNGLLSGGVSDATPALGVVPGGSTNVFARALGIAENPVAATGQILAALPRRRRRRIGLGRADARWFTFCAGLGLDAEVIGRVEQRRARGRTSTNALYVSSALRHFYTATERTTPPLVLERAGHDAEAGLFLGVVSNTAPWTFLGQHPVNPCPAASFDAGLDLFALRRLGTATALRHLAQMLSASGRPPRGESVVALHDQREFTLRARTPTAFQVDGDAVGPRTEVRFTSVPAALPVLA